MNIYKAVANIEASDCSVYILQGDKNPIQITLDNQGKLNTFDTINEGSNSQAASLTYISTVNQFTLLPDLSTEHLPLEEIQTFLKWSPKSNIIKNKLMFENMSVLFQLQLEETTALFPAAQFQHAIEILVNHSMKQEENQAITTLLIDNQLILTVIKNGSLQLSNIFHVENNEEIIYYIMLMIQELELDVEVLNLNLFGECEEKPFLKENLSHFVRNVTSNLHPAISNMKYSGVAQFIELIQ